MRAYLILLIIMVMTVACQPYKEKPTVYRIHKVTEYGILKELKEIKEIQKEILFNQRLKKWNDQRSKY